jgi:hypothetical protein
MGTRHSPSLTGVRLSHALTLWTAPHPAWTANPEWPEEVGFATWQSPDTCISIDPLVRDDLDSATWEPFDAAVSDSSRRVAVLLTAPWHERSAERFRLATTQQSGFTRVWRR